MKDTTAIPTLMSASEALVLISEPTSMFRNKFEQKS